MGKECCIFAHTLLQGKPLVAVGSAQPSRTMLFSLWPSVCQTNVERAAISTEDALLFHTLTWQDGGMRVVSSVWRPGHHNKPQNCSCASQDRGQRSRCRWVQCPPTPRQKGAPVGHPQPHPKEIQREGISLVLICCFPQDPNSFRRKT